MIDNVNHPQHYTSHPSGCECIEIAEHYDFCIGNAIKYLWRNGLKSEEGISNKDKQIEDLKKAIWYINRKIDLIQREDKSDIKSEIKSKIKSEIKSEITGNIFTLD